jgi:hypothetical protein
VSREFAAPAWTASDPDSTPGLPLEELIPERADDPITPESREPLSATRRNEERAGNAEDSAAAPLRDSAVLAASPKPSGAPRPVAVHETRTAVATALSALAGEVANLGVPEGQRAATRAALLDLGRQMDGRSADWDSLRRAIAMVMEYPPLARRAVPLLVPYLDIE